MPINVVEDFTEEATSRKTYEFEGGNKLHCERTNPYGFIKIHAERGAIPEALSGAFTNYDEADKVINKYITEKSKIVTDIKIRGA